MWREYIQATSIEEVIEVLALHREGARLIAGGTDLILEIERGVRTGIDTLVDVSRIPGLNQITLAGDGKIHLGPLVTHSDCASSTLLRERALPLALASWEVGAPQIRNRGTIAGNLITASPANDTIAPLMALKAEVTLRSVRGSRVLPLKSFFTGVRKTVMSPDEMLVDIAFPALLPHQRGMFVKLGLRKAQAISLVNAAMVIGFEDGLDGSAANRIIQGAALTLGAVTPVIVHAEEAEAFLIGKAFNRETIRTAARLAKNSAHPIDDVRASGAYRKEMVEVCVRRGLLGLRDGAERDGIPARPVLLCSDPPGKAESAGKSSTTFVAGSVVQAVVNGQVVSGPAMPGQSLLRWLREVPGLVGTKEGCAEGECGACTVIMDGAAVVSCLVPAQRAHGAVITTIEGVSGDQPLHPVQQAFIDEGAVQCGYCTPGFVVSAVKLLEEKPNPTRLEASQAITGNLCRCTGYYKILSAISKAAQTATPPGGRS